MQVDFSKIDPKKNIIIKGAEVHNLKNVDVVIPVIN
jgi:excinuclease ABC subunit A